ncbi:MAG: family lipase [Nocardioidaceae bacterium]|nr:family lipase [Nocardioidaceae bacterium]
MGAGLALIVGEGYWARNTISISAEKPPSADGLYGDDLGGKPLSVLIIGDSSIVGYGMTRIDDTPPAMLGVGLAHVLDRPIEINSRAVIGAKSSDLDSQIDAGADTEPDIALIVIGANDVTHARRPSEASRELTAAINRLTGMGAKVIVATCPDLGSVKPLPQPLRMLARIVSRRLATLQATAGVRAGARTVSLAGLLGSLFDAKADIMFGVDRFHPSREGYANMISVILPVIAASVREREEFVPSDTPRDMLPIAAAALRASSRGGTELAPAGKWAAVRHRRATWAPHYRLPRRRARV